MPDLTPQMERELAELEAFLAPDLRAERPAPDDAWVRRMDRLMELEFPAAERPRTARRRGRRWSQLLLTAPALGTAAAAVLVIALVFSYQGGDTGDEGSSGSSLRDGVGRRRRQRVRGLGRRRGRLRGPERGERVPLERGGVRRRGPGRSVHVHRRAAPARPARSGRRLAGLRRPRPPPGRALGRDHARRAPRADRRGRSAGVRTSPTRRTASSSPRRSPPRARAAAARSRCACPSPTSTRRWRSWRGSAPCGTARSGWRTSPRRPSPPATACRTRRPSAAACCASSRTRSRSRPPPRSAPGSATSRRRSSPRAPRSGG